MEPTVKFSNSFQVGACFHLRGLFLKILLRYLLKMKPKKPTKKFAMEADGGIRRRKRYTEENVQNALQAIRSGMSKKLASKTFEVPRSTLQFKTKFPGKKSRPGPSTTLTMSEELCLKNWLIDSSKKGFPKRKDDLIASVAEFFKKSGRQNPFKNGIPGEKWYKLFLARHPDISIRTPEAVTSSSAAVAESDIKNWFDDIHKYLHDNNLTEVIKDPRRVFNGDETNFLLCPKSGVVLAAKGNKNVYEIDNAPAKTSLTVLFTFSADGRVTPPLVIFPLKRLPGDLRSKVPSDWGIGLSNNGWMKSEIFKSYIENILHPHLIEKGIEFPIIFYVDGHKTHLTYEVSEICSKLNIVLIALYPNCTRILQPADVSAFKPLKSGWQKTVLEWRRNNPSQALTKYEFVPLLKKTIDKSITPSTIQNGFRATGLYPFDKDAVDYTKCLGKNKVPDRQVEGERNDESDLHVKMTIHDFKAIINKQTLRMLEDGNNYGVDPDLRKVYQFLTGSQHLQKESTNCEINNIQQKPTETEHLDIENMNVIIADDFANEIEIGEDIVISQNDTDTQDFEHVLEITHTAQIHNNNNKENLEICQVEHHKNNHAENSPKPSINYNKIEVTSIVENARFSCPPMEDLKPISINDVLVLPKTPERKGNRNIKKTPFVLTSAVWQELEMKKKREKEEKEEGVRKRKEERERKKIEKSQIKKVDNKTKPKRTTKKQRDKYNDANIVMIQPSTSAHIINNDISTTRGENYELQDIFDNKTETDSEPVDYEPKDIKQRRISKAYTTEELEKILSERIE